MDHIAELIAGNLDANQQRFPMAMSNLSIQSRIMEVLYKSLEFLDSRGKFWRYEV